MIKIDIDITGAEPVKAELRSIMAMPSPDGSLLAVLGRGLAGHLRAHYRQMNTKPNKLGGQRTNFWSGVASGVQNPVATGNGVEVTISHPHILQKLYGGLIRPRNVKNLAIPVKAESYGRSPRTFTDLAWLPSRMSGPGGATGYLVQGMKRVATRGKNKGKEVIVPKAGGSLLYVLRGAVYQEPTPGAIPPDADMVDAAVKAGREWLKAQGQSGVA